MEVRICARGTLTEATRSELVGFDESADGALVVLRGSVVDQPALLGVLERLRRAGLHVRDVEAVPEGRGPARPTARSAVAVARFEFRGRVADLLELLVEGAQLTECPETTTMEVPLPDDGDALFDVLARLERLALEIHEVHVHREVTGPGERPRG